jgi:hypothetical protein
MEFELGGSKFSWKLKLNVVFEFFDPSNWPRLSDQPCEHGHSSPANPCPEGLHMGSFLEMVHQTSFSVCQAEPGSPHSLLLGTCTSKLQAPRPLSTLDRISISPPPASRLVVDHDTTQFRHVVTDSTP